MCGAFALVCHFCARLARWTAEAAAPLPLAVRHCRLLDLLATLEGFVALVYFVPVDYVPPGGQIFRTAVVVFQVVGVLPDVVAEDGIKALRDGAVLIGRGDDLDFAAFAGQPDPPGAELFYAGVVKFG